MALHRPDRIAGVAALSSCVYPFQINYRYANAPNCKILVYRGSRDHQFVGDGERSANPYYVKAEAEFGQRLEHAAEQHVFKVWPGDTHAEVHKHAPTGFKEVASYARPNFPKKIARCFLDPSEAQMEWITIVEFEFPNDAFRVADQDWHQVTQVSFDRMQPIVSRPIVQASISGSNIDIKSSGIRKFDVYINPAMIGRNGRNRSIDVLANGKRVWRGEFSPSFKTLVEDYEQRGDAARLYWQKIRIIVPRK